MRQERKPPVVLLTIAIAFFLFALTQLKDAIRTYQIADAEYRLNMTLFIIFLCLSCVLAGLYFGIWWERSHKDKTPSQRKNAAASSK